MKRDSRAPLIVAIVLLLLPALYVGSYLALVREPLRTLTYTGNVAIRSKAGNYRFRRDICERVYWPLEQIDRVVRPGAWDWPDSK